MGVCCLQLNIGCQHGLLCLRPLFAHLKPVDTDETADEKSVSGRMGIPLSVDFRAPVQWDLEVIRVAKKEIAEVRNERAAAAAVAPDSSPPQMAR